TSNLCSYPPFSSSLCSKTGVTHASVPSKISSHSSLVFVLNISVKIAFIPSHLLLSYLSLSRPLPFKPNFSTSTLKNCGSTAPTAIYRPLSLHSYVSYHGHPPSNQFSPLG